MLVRQTAALVVIAATGPSVIAWDSAYGLEKLPVRTLPQDLYGRLVKGSGLKGLSFAWKDEDYDHSLGFAVKYITFNPSKPLPERFQAHLKARLAAVEDRQSPYQLQLSVVDVGTFPGLFSKKPAFGYVAVEGLITLFEKPIAAFMTCETSGSKAEDGGFKLDFAIDAILDSFANEIMLPASGERMIPLAHPFFSDLLSNPHFAKSEARQRLQDGLDKLDAKDGFRDRKFGMSIEAFLKRSAKPDQKKGLVILQDPKDDLEIGRATASSINYVFWKGRLVRVEIAFKGWNGNDQTAARAHQALKLLYGRGLWSAPIRPYLDSVVEVVQARGGVGRNPLPVNPIVWPGQRVHMMLDGLLTGEGGTHRPSTVSPVLLTLDSVPLAEAMRRELAEQDQRKAMKPNM